MEQLLSQGPLFIACLVFLMGIVIAVHEYGHYIAGRAVHAAAESFSIGFGPPLAEVRDRRGTRWRLNWIPLGGFVRFAEAAEVRESGGELDGKPFDALTPLQKIFVSLAGPFANFVLAALLFALIIGVNGVPRHAVEVVEVVPGMPAAEAGMRPGDRILQISGRDVLNTSDVSTRILVSPGLSLTVMIERAGERIELAVVPREVMRENEFGQMVMQSTAGIMMAKVEIGEPQKFGLAGSLAAGIARTGDTIEQTVVMLGRIATGNMSIHAMSGPVGVADVSRRIVNRVMEQEAPLDARLSALTWMLLSLVAAISVGVGFFNLLPLPVLDGGRVVFHAYEALAGASMPARAEDIALKAGVVLLLVMVAVITWGDVVEMGVFGRGG